MSIDISLLQLMKTRKEYDRLRRVVNSRTLEQRTQVILKDFGRYFEQAEDCEVIPLTGSFFTWFSMVAHRSLTDEDLQIYKHIFSKAEPDPEPGARDMLLHKLMEADLALRVSETLAAYDAEEEVDLPKLMRSFVEDFESNGRRNLQLPVVEADESLFDDDVNNTGFHWRWEALNRSMRPLRPGDFGILAGRPDTGKTTALSDNMTYMASQLDTVYPDDPERTILWLNNEGPGNRILKRCVQSALGLTTGKLVEMQKAGELWDAYEKALGCDRTRLKVLNIHGYKAWQVEEILRQLKPGLVIFDMIDSVNFDGSIINGGQRQDSILEGMYQWARELGVRFDCPIIATSQISADGDGMPYPTLSMLKDSKCFAAGTPVRMADGSVKTIETIGVGEQVMGVDGTPRNVTGTGQGEEPMYRVAGKGWHFDCNESHNLVVQNNTHRKTAGLEHGQVRDMSLREFMDRGSSKDRLSAVRCRVPYAEQGLPIDPYLFGLWLGDGHSQGLRITTGDDAVRAYLESLPTYRSTYQQASNCVDVYVGGNREIKELGVYRNKRVPQVYKTASIQQRLALLAGLMDSDGYREVTGSMVIAMSAKHPDLIDDIEEVARSLGYRCSQNYKASTNSTNLYIANTDELPVLLQHKRGVCRDRGDRMTVESLGWGRYYGITVDGDSRYCHAKYVALRNTGKQGAADFIITVGARNEEAFQNVRFVGATKNKLALEGMPKSPRAELVFDGPAGRYVESK